MSKVGESIIQGASKALEFILVVAEDDAPEDNVSVDLDLSDSQYSVHREVQAEN